MIRSMKAGTVKVCRFFKVRITCDCFHYNFCILSAKRTKLQLLSVHIKVHYNRNANKFMIKVYKEHIKIGNRI